MGVSTLIKEIGYLLSMVTFSCQVQCRGTGKEFAFKLGCERKMCVNEIIFYLKFTHFVTRYMPPVATSV